MGNIEVLQLVPILPHIAPILKMLKHSTENPRRLSTGNN